MLAESGKPAEEAAGVRLLRREQDRAVFAIESGSYFFTSSHYQIAPQQPFAGTPVLSPKDTLLHHGTNLAVTMAAKPADAAIHYTRRPPAKPQQKSGTDPIQRSQRPVFMRLGASRRRVHRSAEGVPGLRRKRVSCPAKKLRPKAPRQSIGNLRLLVHNLMVFSGFRDHGTG